VVPQEAQTRGPEVFFGGRGDEGLAEADRGGPPAPLLYGEDMGERRYGEGEMAVVRARLDDEEDPLYFWQ
jgi:hypothetical protein